MASRQPVRREGPDVYSLISDLEEMAGTRFNSEPEKNPLNRKVEEVKAEIHQLEREFKKSAPMVALKKKLEKAEQEVKDKTFKLRGMIQKLRKRHFAKGAEDKEVLKMVDEVIKYSESLYS